MNTFLAVSMGLVNAGKEQMVFDWDKAAQRIRESGTKEAYAGLAGDWEYTGGCIFKDGRPNRHDYTFLASTWATPELVIDGESEPCYKMASETPGWGSETKWPESALAILYQELLEVGA